MSVDELKNTKENTIDQLEADIETFLARYEKLKQEKEHLREILKNRKIASKVR